MPANKPLKPTAQVIQDYLDLLPEDKKYERMGIVIAARAVYHASKAMVVFLHSPKPAQYVVDSYR
jgi:hypothetical protein